MLALECSPGQAAEVLRPVLKGKANPGDRCSMQEILNGTCYRVFNGRNQVIGAYVLRPIGNEVWIQAAGGSAEIDLCDLFDALIIKHGAGFASIGFRTFRRGLVKKALKRGYTIISDIDGYVMRKKI